MASCPCSVACMRIEAPNTQKPSFGLASNSATHGLYEGRLPVHSSLSTPHMPARSRRAGLWSCMRLHAPAHSACSAAGLSCVHVRIFSRMRRRRVPVLKLGSRGPGGDAKSLRLWTQASAIVRNRSQSSAIVRNRPQSFASVRGGSDMPERRKSSRNAELSSLFTFRTTKVSNVSTVFNSHRDRGVLVAKRRTVVTFGLVPGLRVSKVSTVFNSRRDRGVLVAKRRTVVTFGLVPGLRVLKVSNVSTVFNRHRDRGGPGRETQNWRHFWTRLGSSRLKSVKCVNSIQQSQGSGGSWSRNAELSSLLDSSRVFASQKCQQYSTVTGIGGVLVAKRRTVVTFGLVSGLRVSKVSTVFNSHRDRGGSWSRNAKLSSLCPDSPSLSGGGMWGGLRERPEIGLDLFHGKAHVEGGSRDCSSSWLSL